MKKSWRKEEAMAQTLTGKITRILFQASDSLYCVVAMEKEDGGEFRAAGPIAQCELNSSWQLEGDWMTHPRYGKQFRIELARPVQPKGESAVVAYLHNKIDGIGKKTAQKIYDALGDEAIEKICENPEVLILECHLSQRQADKIAPQLQKLEGTSKSMMTLLEAGLGGHEIDLLLGAYSNPLAVLKDDAFRPFYEIKGFGYNAALKAADAFDMAPNDIRRLSAAMYDRLCSMTMSSGSTAIPIEHWMDEYRALSKPELEMAIDGLKKQKVLGEENGFVYAYGLLKEEKAIAATLKEHLHRIEPVSSYRLHTLIENAQKEENITYDARQIEGIETFFNHSMMILNGGPGTGKSTTVKGILYVLSRLFPSAEVCLCAPTGRAAKRMAQLSDSPARTIHSLLEWDMTEDSFGKCHLDPLRCDFLIVDEFSMVDTHLFASLLDALEDDCRILLIGDEDQLPSVGPGQVFADLIASKKIPIVHLQTLFRQASGSGIARLASQIRQEQPCQYEDGVTFYPADSDEVYRQLNRLLDEYGSDLQVMAPKYKGSTGIDALNAFMQEKLNPFAPGKGQLCYGELVFRQGDRVMLKKNMPEMEVFNGDLGVISEVDEKKKSLTVEFDDAFVEFDTEIPTLLTHSWCISIHKSQGSEYPAAALVCLREAAFMMYRKLLYTGISRAKKQLYLLGDRSLFETQVRRQPRFERNTTLVNFLSDLPSIAPSVSSEDIWQDAPSSDCKNQEDEEEADGGQAAAGAL